MTPAGLCTHTHIFRGCMGRNQWQCWGYSTATMPGASACRIPTAVLQYQGLPMCCMYHGMLHLCISVNAASPPPQRHLQPRRCVIQCRWHGNSSMTATQQVWLRYMHWVATTHKRHSAWSCTQPNHDCRPRRIAVNSCADLNTQCKRVVHTNPCSGVHHALAWHQGCVQTQCRLEC